MQYLSIVQVADPGGSPEPQQRGLAGLEAAEPRQGVVRITRARRRRPAHERAAPAVRRVLLAAARPPRATLDTR